MKWTWRTLIVAHYLMSSIVMTSGPGLGSLKSVRNITRLNYENRYMQEEWTLLRKLSNKSHRFPTRIVFGSYGPAGLGRRLRPRPQTRCHDWIGSMNRRWIKDNFSPSPKIADRGVLDFVVASFSSPIVPSSGIALIEKAWTYPGRSNPKQCI